MESRGRNRTGPRSRVTADVAQKRFLTAENAKHRRTFLQSFIGNVMSPYGINILERDVKKQHTINQFFWTK